MTLTLHDHLVEKLRLSIGDAARVTGVSVRQLSYWTKKGLVRAHGSPRKKRYDYRALQRITLIKSHLTEGYALAEAARLAEYSLHQQRLSPLRRQIAEARLVSGR